MNMKQLLAAGLTATMLLPCMACSSDDAAASSASAASSATSSAALPDNAAESAMTVNGVTYTVADYASFLNSVHVDWTTYLSYFGMTEEDYLAEGELDNEAYTAELRARAESYLVQYQVMQEKMDEYGLTLTDEEQSMIEMYIEMGLGETFAELPFMIDAVTAYCMGEGGPYAPEEADVQAVFHDGYLRCKHVLIKTVDDSYNELENQDELEATAKDIAARAQAGEDFDSLIEAYGEDPGMESNPDGYVFTEGTMVDEFYQGTLALDEGGVSEPIKSSYGWHIIQRLPLRDEDLASVREEIVGAMVSFDTVMMEWAAAADVSIEDAAAEVTLENCTAYLA